MYLLLPIQYYPIELIVKVEQAKIQLRTWWSKVGIKDHLQVPTLLLPGMNLQSQPNRGQRFGMKQCLIY